MTTVILNNEILLQEIQEDSAKKHLHHAHAAQLIAYALSSTNHLAATIGGSLNTNDDPWAGFNWPVAPTGSGSSVNSNPANSPVDPFSGDPNGGYLQQLSELLQELQQNPTDLNLLPTLIELLANIGNNPAIANDPEFQKIMQNFPVGADGQPALAGIAQIIVLMEFNAQGGNLANVSTFITQLLSMPGMNSPLMSDFSNELQQLQANLGTLTQNYMQNGQIGYMDNDDLFGPNGQFIPCSSDQFYTYIGGLLANDIVAPSWGGNPQQSFSSTIQALMDAQIKELLDEMKKVKNPGEAMILLLMLVTTSKDDMYQNQLSGLANTTQWLSGQTGSISSLIGDLNPNEFSGTNGAANAQNFIGNLIQSYESAKANPNASGLTASLKSAIEQILNIKDPNGNTLLSDYQKGDMTNLAAGLNAACQNLTTGDGLNLLNSLKQMSQSFTNESQSIGTQIQAVSANDTQIVNVLKTALTDNTSGIIAAENSITSNQKTS